MKKFYITIILSLLVAALYAQTAGITDHNGDAVNAGDTVYYFSHDMYTSHEVALTVKNTSSATITYKVKRTDISLVSGSSASFCWEQCYPPSTYISPNGVAIAAGASSNPGQLQADYKDKDNEGSSIVAYTVFDETDVNDSMYFIVKYTITDNTSINDNKNSLKYSNAYPNPAKDYFIIDYNFNNASIAKIELLNVLGSIVLTQEISTIENMAKIKVSNLNAGVYFYNIIVDGNRVESKKIIIK
ncbi:MAG: T9SS type A sorting domain-containing protein [Bacteroidales bacterium]|nr:T9SS type A sorting domain-containing protein [Bacteroidales bacterium]